MKTRYFILALSLAGLFFSCDKTPQRELAAPEDLVTISVTIPDDGVKAGAGEKTSLSWTWSSGDQLVIVGETTETFTIKPGFTPKKAEFIGTPVKGERFSIYYPDAEAGSADWSAQVQKGNNNLDHLKYTAALEGVDSYLTFSFSPEWAEEHGGFLSQVGVMKFVLTPPATVTNVTSVSFSTEEALLYSGNGDAKVNELTLQLQGVTLAAGDKLTAWMITSWNEAVIPASTPFQVKITADGMTYKQSLSKATESVIKTGMVNIITLSDASLWQDDTPRLGSGTESDPWIIANRSHLIGMEADLAAGETRYFKLGADLDMEGVTWTPVSCSGGKKIVFDGANHAISHLGASFIGELDGTVKDLILDGSTVSVSAITGALVNKVAASTNATVSNVQLKNSSVTSTNYAGGLIGESDGNLVLTGCTVTNTNVSGSLAGGVVGFLNHNGTSFNKLDNCSFVGGTVKASARYCGGIAGSVSQALHVISNCSAKDAAVTSSADRVGGFVGQLQKTATITHCNLDNVTVTGGASSGTSNTSGFVGVCYGIVNKCSVSGGSVTATGNNIGGFTAYPENATINDCYASTVVNGGSYTSVGGFIGILKSNTTVNYCYETATVNGSATSVGAFIGSVNFKTTDVQSSVTKCIAWDAALPFYGEVANAGTDGGIHDNYCGKSTSTTISTTAQDQGWSSDIWDFSGDEPKLK